MRGRTGAGLRSSRRAGGVGLDTEEDALLVRLREGDEEAFAHLIDRYHALTVHVARTYVRSHEVAEEVAQEAWIGVIQGLPRFEGRSTLKTWILRIVANIARTRALREARSVPFSAIAGEEDDAIDLRRFRGADDPFPGHWRSYPRNWRALPEEASAMRETLDVVKAAIEALPEKQRLVITLRDIEGWNSAETAAALDLTDTNLRVLLHRARSRVRAALERHLEDE